MVDTLISMIEEFLDSKASSRDYLFFEKLEDFIFEHYDEIMKINEDIGSLANDDLVDLCSEIGYESDCDEARTNLKKFLDKIVYLNKEKLKNIA